MTAAHLGVWSAERLAEFPLVADTTYLDAASIGPVPARSLRALDAFNARRTTPHLLSKDEQFGVLDRGRELAARMIGATPGEIALATNTSFGLNLAARALPLEAGDIVLVSRREFPANVYPWMKLEDLGVTLEFAPCTAEGWPNEEHLIARMRDPRVKVLAVSLVQFSNGYKVNLERLSQVSRHTGTWLVVDAIQGIGHQPLDLSSVEVDILACGAQKWLLSPWGTGFMYVRKGILDRLRPPFAGWMAFRGTDDFNRLTDYDPAWRDDARRFELITLPYQDFAAMNASLELLLDIGVPAIAAHLGELSQALLELADRNGWPVTSPRGAAATPITCLRVPDAARVHAALRAEHVICSLREGGLRFSPHIYNTMEDMERTAELLRSV